MLLPEPLLVFLENLLKHNKKIQEARLGFKFIQKHEKLQIDCKPLNG